MYNTYNVYNVITFYLLHFTYLLQHTYTYIDIASSTKTKKEKQETNCARMIKIDMIKYNLMLNSKYKDVKIKKSNPLTKSIMYMYIVHVSAMLLIK